MTDQPLTPIPGGAYEIDPREPLIADGTIVEAVVMTAKDGSHKLPAVMFRFVQPDGSFLPPIILRLDEARIGGLIGLIAAAAEFAAIKAKG